MAEGVSTKTSKDQSGHQSEPLGRETKNVIGASGPQSGLLGLQRMLGKTWEMKTRQRGAFSQAEEKVIGLKTSATCAIAARHIIHEVHHQNQPGGMKPNEVETDAYTFEEDWSIKRGLPGVYRTTKDTGEEIPDVKDIEEHVKKRYSGAAADKPEERVIGHTPAGKAKVLKPDGKKTYERKAVKGESHQDFEKTKANLENLPKVDPKEWVCPGTKKSK